MHALQMTHATCERTGFYARIRRWQEKEREESMITMAIGSTPQLSLATPSSLSSDSGGATSTSISFESSSRQRKRNERRVEYLKANSTALTDVERTSEAMSKRTLFV